MSYYASLAKIASAEAALGAPIALEDSLVLKQLVVALGNVTGGGGGGTVTSFSFTDGAGITGVVTDPTTTPALALTLGAITPTSVNGLTLAAAAVGFTIAGGTTSKTLTVLDTGTAALLGIANAFTAAQSITLTGLGTTLTAGLSLLNSTAAAAGAQQISPSLIIGGQGWKTDATAASQSFDFRLFTTPVQGTSAPKGVFSIIPFSNGSTATNGWNFQSDGTHARLWINGSGGDAAVYVGSTIASGQPAATLSSANGVVMSQNHYIGWVNGFNASGTRDTALYRDAAGIIGQRADTAAQAHRIYYSYTDALNYARIAINTASSVMTIACETAGTGADNIDLGLTPAGTGLVAISTAASSDVAVASTHSARVKFNGTEYKILLATP